MSINTNMNNSNEQSKLFKYKPTMPLNNHIKLIYFIVNNAVIFAVAGGAAIVVAVADVAFAATDVAATIAATIAAFTI